MTNTNDNSANGFGLSANRKEASSLNKSSAPAKGIDRSDPLNSALDPSPSKPATPSASRKVDSTTATPTGMPKAGANVSSAVSDGVSENPLTNAFSNAAKQVGNRAMESFTNAVDAEISEVMGSRIPNYLDNLAKMLEASTARQSAAHTAQLRSAEPNAGLLGSGQE